MKKLVALAACTALFIAPAYAAKITIEFAPADGESHVVTLDPEAGTLTSGDITLPATFNPDENSMCVTVDESEQCTVFDGEARPLAPGEKVGFTASNGQTGTATILSID